MFGWILLYRCDSGGDCECFCTAVADFAERCNQAGYPVKWRSQKVCREYHSIRVHVYRSIFFNVLDV